MSISVMLLLLFGGDRIRGEGGEGYSNIHTAESNGAIYSLLYPLTDLCAG